jgi:hypothetical protein
LPAFIALAPWKFINVIDEIFTIGKITPHIAYIKVPFEGCTVSVPVQAGEIGNAGSVFPRMEPRTVGAISGALVPLECRLPGGEPNS